MWPLVILQRMRNQEEKIQLLNSRPVVHHRYFYKRNKTFLSNKDRYETLNRFNITLIKNSLLFLLLIDTKILSQMRNFFQLQFYSYFNYFLGIMWIIYNYYF